MTDKELRDAAVAELKLTTVGWTKVKSYSPEKLAPTHWGKAMALLAQIGQAPSPPGSNYPATYYTGPLGVNNILPTKLGAFLGVWGPSLPGGSATWEQIKTLIQQREAAMGRTYDIIMTTDTTPSLFPENRLPWINSHGAIAACHLGAGFSLSGVVAGSHNAEIDTLISRWGGYTFPVMIRLFHEFDQPTSYYGLTNPSLFQDAWRYIVNRFASQGADNCGFWWCPTEGGDRAGVCYPGDPYVDWVGSDGYNWPLHGEILYATPYESGWVGFDKVFDYPPGGANLVTMHNSRGPTKPFVIGEVGCTFDFNSPYQTTKGDWYRAIPAAAQNMEYLRGICFFDVDASGESAGGVYPQRNNWLVDRLDTYPQILAGFVAMAQDSYFNTRA